MGVFDAVSTSISGLSSQAYALNNISGNIANSTTAGFKRTETAFSDLLPDRNNFGNLGAVGGYSRLTSTVQGQVTASDTPTNIALNGEGYFVVSRNSGTSTAPVFDAQPLYTRRGDFQQNANGYLVNGAGYYLAGSAAASGVSTSNAPLQLPASALANGTLSGVTVSSTGAVQANSSTGQAVNLGQITVAHIADSFLRSADGGAFEVTDPATGILYGLNTSSISGSALELSNTNISDQFSKLIVTQQAYAANTNALNVENQMLQDAVNLYR